MPVRSTPFQKLVHHIQQQLSDGASVVESEMLRHRGTGHECEVDIVIRSVVAEHPVVVSIECIEHSRPADRPWVEKMKAKHEHLETNKLVLVSLSGFYEPAINLAAFYGITTYTPAEACTANWTEIVGQTNLFVARYDFTPEMMYLVLESTNGLTLLPAGPSTRIRRPDLSVDGNLGELVSFVLHHQAFARPALDGIKHDGDGTIDFEFKIDKPLLALDEEGREHPVVAVQLKVKSRRRTSPLEITSLTWKDTPVAFGHGQTVLGDTLITVVEKAPGQMDARVVIDGKSMDIYYRED